ncbi:unnamed protein product, partial [Closterium sp. NIES-54]
MRALCSAPRHAASRTPCPAAHRAASCTPCPAPRRAAPRTPFPAPCHAGSRTPCPAPHRAASRSPCPAPCPAALRVVPCCSPRVALYCPARRALLQPARSALLPCASRPTACPLGPPRALPSRRHACPLRPLPRPPIRPAAGPAFALPRLPVRPVTGPPVRPSRTCLLRPLRAHLLRPPCLRFAPAAGLHSLSRAALPVCAAARASALPCQRASALPCQRASALPCARWRPALPCPSRLCNALSPPPLVLYELGSSLYTLTTAPPQVAASASASGQQAGPCSCRALSHQTLLWHHRLGHPSVARLHGMHSRLLVSGLPRSLPPLPPSPAPPCLPCIEVRQRAAPHSSSFPSTTVPLQTLHLDVWGPARVRGQGHERLCPRYVRIWGCNNKSTAASTLVAELVGFAAACRLDYATSLVTESESVCPQSVGGECALGTDVLEDRQKDFECFAAAVPHLVSMLIAPEGDPDAPDIPTPSSYAEAIEGPYSSQWQSAMDAEMASWKSTGTYVDEVPQPGANIVSVMWIFRVKRPPGSPPVFKARYVAQGSSQRQGVDFFHTLSPTPKMTTLRPARGDLAAPPTWLHWVVSTRYPVEPPAASLRQAPREWHDTLRTTLAALGFAPSTADPSLFLRTDTSLPTFYILVYVNDLVFATADTAGLAHVKSELQKRHTCTDLGELRSYLGLQIIRDRARRTITLTQSYMVQQVLQRFRFEYSSPQSTPLPTGHSLSALPSDESVEPSGMYLELVGCLMYLMTCTRPDLPYPLSILPRYVAPGRRLPEHWKVAKRVMRYLCSTSGMGLVLGGRARVVLTGHADASWVDDFATQRSSQRYTFSVWQKRQ